MQQGGRRTKTLSVETLDNLPLITIITVVRNCELLLEQTILNVVNQKCLNIEYIIVDGNSSDKTVEIIRKYEDKISYWISEPDSGIYDAMNKGIGFAKGSWINFMNAGDEFFDQDVCEKLSFELSRNHSDVVYGDVFACNQIYKSGILIKAKSLNDIWKGMIFSHQSCFIRSDVIRLFLFNLKYKLAADFEQILSIFLRNYLFCYLPITISRVRIGGLSYSNNRTIIEQIKIIHSRKPYTYRLLYFGMLYMLNMLSSILGKKLKNYFRELKWKYFSNDPK